MRKWILGVGIVGVLGMTGVVNAQFAVQGEPRQATEYGNAHSSEFETAMTEGEPFTKEELREASTVVPEKEWGRGYARFGFNKTTLEVRKIKDSSSGVFAGTMPSPSKAEKDQTGLELAIGSVWSPNWRGEFEFFNTKNIPYSAAIAGGIIDTRAKNLTLLGNIYYDFHGFHGFQPYVMAGLGVAVNKTEGTYTASVANAIAGVVAGQVVTLKGKRVFNLAGNLGVGARYRIFDRWYVDFAYRYGSLGTVKWNDKGASALTAGNQPKLKGDALFSGVTFGFIFLF